MSITPKSFTSATTGPVFRGQKGVPFTYSLSGTFSATLVLEKSEGGNAWEPVVTLTAAAVAQHTPSENASYRFKCSAYTSGTAVTSIYDIVNEEQRETVYVDVASTANGTLATAFAAGQTLDGITLAAGHLILLKDQSTGAQNGLYRVEASGAPTRLSDIEHGGALVYVKTGTLYADTVWQCTTDGVIVLGTTSLAYGQVGGNRYKTIVVPAGALGKAGATAGWVVAAGDDVNLATCPQSQTASTLVVPAPTLRVGDTITGFYLIGQIESAGNGVTVDAALRKQTAAAADVTDASIGAITQISVTADTAITSANSTKTLATPEVVGADETFYALITATTGASTDIALQGVAFVVTEAP